MKEPEIGLAHVSTECAKSQALSPQPHLPTGCYSKAQTKNSSKNLKQLTCSKLLNPLEYFSIEKCKCHSSVSPVLSSEAPPPAQSSKVKESHCSAYSFHSVNGPKGKYAKMSVVPDSQSPVQLSPQNSRPTKPLIPLKPSKRSFSQMNCQTVPVYPAPPCTPLYPPLPAFQCYYCYPVLYPIPVGYWHCQLPYWAYPHYNQWWYACGYCLPICCYPPWYYFPVACLVACSVACNCQICASEMSQQKPNEIQQPYMCIPSLNEANSPYTQLSNEANLPLLQVSSECSSYPTQLSNEASLPLLQVSSEASSYPTQLLNEASLPRFQASKETSSPPTQLLNEANLPLLHASSEANSLPTQLLNEASLPLLHASSETNLPLLQVSSEASSPTQLLNEASLPRFQASNETSSPPTQLLNEASLPLLHASSEANSPPTQLSNEGSLRLLHASSEANLPLLQASSEASSYPTQRLNGASLPQSQASNEASSPPTQLSNEANLPLLQVSSGVNSPPTQLLNEASLPFLQTSSEANSLPTQLSNEASLPQSQASNETSSPPTQLSNEANLPLLQVSSEASSPLVQLSSETNSPLIQPLSEVAFPRVQLLNEASLPPTQLLNKASSTLFQLTNKVSSPFVQPLSQANLPSSQLSNETTSPPVQRSNEATLPFVQPSIEFALPLVQPISDASSPLVQLSKEASSFSSDGSNLSTTSSNPTGQSSSGSSMVFSPVLYFLESGEHGKGRYNYINMTNPSFFCYLNSSSYRDALSLHRVPLLLEVCVALIALLLLLAGDVERNPGPTMVTEDKVPQLAALLDEEAANWFLVLTQLGVSRGKLNEIRLDSFGQPTPAKYCMTVGLQHWVVSDECPAYEMIMAVFDGDFLTNKSLAKKVGEFAQRVKTGHTKMSSCGRGFRTSPLTSATGTLMSEGLARAGRGRGRGFSKSRAVGTSPIGDGALIQRNKYRHASSANSKPSVPLPRDNECFDASPMTSSSLQSAVAVNTSRPSECHHENTTSTRGILSIQDLSLLQFKLTDVAFQWKSIGIELGFREQILDRINRKVLGSPIESLTELLTLWLQKQNPPPTLETLANVIGGSVIQDRALAHSLQLMQLETSDQHHSLLHASTTDDVIAGYADQMRSYYRTTVPQCFALTWPPPPTRKVFNLSMISHKQYNYGRGNDELIRLLYLGNVDKVMTLTSMTNVELKDLFHLNEANRQVVLIEGAPGAGKSTLAWDICKKWEARELFREFKLVVFVQLRDPAVQSAKSLADLFPSSLKSLAREIVSRMETKGGEGLLFVLDGWDEFLPGLGGNRIVKDLICNPLKVDMYSSSILITSRPIASSSLYQYTSSRVEIVGFKLSEMELYFKEALQNDSRSIRELNVCLQTRPVIKASCYLPLNAVIVVHLFLSLNNSLPNTLHGVFLQLVIHCIVRHIMKQQDGDSELPRIASLDDLSEDMQTQLGQICSMAYHGVMKNKVTFSEDDLKAFNLPPDINTLSLIQVVISFMPYRSRSYNFLHLSVQELLTSYHISKLPPDQQVKIFSDLFGQPRFASVFHYYAAFTKLQTAGIRKIVTSMIGKKTAELHLTLLQCLYEAQDASLCKLIASDLNGELCIFNKSLSPVDCIAVGYFLRQCAAVFPMTAKMSNCSLDSYKLELLGKELKQPSQGVKFSICLDVSSSIESGPVNADGNLTKSIATELITPVSQDTSSTILSKLDLSGNPIQNGEDGLIHLCQALTTNTSLEELNLSHCNLNITRINGLALSNMLCANKTLKLLNLLPIKHINGQGLRYFSEYINSSLHNLTELNLSSKVIQCDEDGLSCLCNTLATNKSIVQLSLSNCSLPQACGPALCHMLTTNKTLASLNLSLNPSFSAKVHVPQTPPLAFHTAKFLRSPLSARSPQPSSLLTVRHTATPLTPQLAARYRAPTLTARPVNPVGRNGRDVVSYIAKGLKSNHSLKSLNLHRCGINDSGMMSLADCLKVNDSLEELDLHVNNISTGAAHSFSDMLKHNRTLKKLDMSGCNLTGEAMKSLASALVVNSTLEDLDISGKDRLTDTALVALGESLKKNTGLKILRILYFSSNKTTPYGWKQFVQCLKDNTSLELLRTHHRDLNVKDVNTVRRQKSLPELRTT